MPDTSSALLSAPFQPRLTIREKASSTSTRFCLALFAMVGAATVLFEIGRSSATSEDVPAILLLVVCAGVISIVGFYVQSVLAGAIGRLIGGSASNTSVRRALALGAIPMVWAAFIGAILLVLHMLTGAVVLSQIASAVFAITFLWMLVTTVAMLMEVQGYGLVRALATLATAGIVSGLLLTVLFRGFVLQPFKIPASSLMPTLLVGDHLFVSKYAYGYNGFSVFLDKPILSNRILASKPKRGDVVVFKLPKDNRTDYIKRIIGMPGDTIQLKQGIVYIDGKAVPRKRVEDFQINSSGKSRSAQQYIETLPNGASYRVLDLEPQRGHFDNTSPYKVPENHYFVLGDNRDNSSDSRAMQSIGFIPLANLIGRAELIYLSISPDGQSRGGRMMSRIK